MTNAFDSVKGDVGGTTENKLKAFLTSCLGHGRDCRPPWHHRWHLGDGKLDYFLALAFDWGVEKQTVSLSFLRPVVRSQLDKRIGAREASHTSS